MAMKPAAIRPRQRVTSTLGPKMANIAGNSVSEAIMVKATVSAAAMPRPETNDKPMVSMPSSDNTTVIPANATARPAVSMAPTMASSNEAPSRLSSR